MSDMFHDSLSPQGRAGKLVYLLMKEGPLRSEEMTRALGYRSRFGLYDLLERLSPAVPLYYDEREGVWGILPEEESDDEWHE